MRKICITITFFVFITALVFSQKAFQTIRGNIYDKDSKAPLPGVSIFLPGTTPILGTNTNSNGEFAIQNVQPGRYDLQISYLGYKEQTINNLEVTSGKEVVINIAIEESVISVNEVTIVGQRNKTQALNEMSAISARTFSVEETGRYAGSRNDVSRMATNYAGVSNGDDSRNDIVIRGNSPTGLLWKLEEMEIPSPNHFTSVGSSGGPVSMLNYNVIANSDFMTGAFAAEYGNATSGVFDIKLRNGNNQKREYMLQAGALGTELMLEGPFSKKYNGSYLINYRFSTTSVLTAMGINFGYSGKADYQDITFNFNLPVTNKVTIGLFGMGGNSIYKVLYKDKKEADFSPGGYLNTNNFYKSATGVGGVSFQYRISENSYFKTIAGISGIGELGKEDSVGLTSFESYSRYIGNNYQYKLTSHSYLKSKINARNKIKFGFIADNYNYKFDTKYGVDINNSLIQMRLGNGSANLLQAYGQWNFSFTDNLTLNSGMHYQYLQLNDDQVFEPRTALKWSFKPKQSLSIGYGLHSQMQVLPIYFVSSKINNRVENINKNLEFSKSQQFVIGYSSLLSSNIAFKAETYYQYLFDIPINSFGNSSSYSAINEGMSYIFSDEDSLINNGTGRNIGIEFTLERFFNKGFYYLFTTSLFDSNYKGSDQIQRNTAFNGQYVFNVLGGKEFILSNRSKLLFDIKFSTSGGKRYTPIDYEASKSKGVAVRIDNQAYTKQFKNYYRTDIKITYRFNGLGKAHEVFVNIDNVFNNKNIFAQSYDSKKNQLGYIYQLGIFPTFQYKIFF